MKLVFIIIVNILISAEISFAQIWVNNNDLYGSHITKILKSSKGSLFVYDFYSNIYRSNDETGNWKKLFVVDSLNKIKDLYSFDSLLVAITYYNGLFRSSDEGENWLPINNGLATISANSLTLIGKDSLILSTNQGLFLSSNLGNAWSSFAHAGKQVNYFFKDKLSYYYACVEGFGSYRSTNRGITWQSISLSTQINKMIASDDNKLFAKLSSSGYFYKSTDNGISWLKISMNFYPVSILDFDYLHQQSVLVLAASSGLIYYYSSSLGITDSLSIDEFGTSLNSLYYFNDSILYAGSNKGPLKSTNNGQSWISLNGELKSFVVYLLAKNKHRMITNTSLGVYSGDSEGNYWERIKWNKTYRINSLKITEDDKIFVASDSGIFRSTDLGNNWIRFQSKPNLISRSVFLKAIDTIIICGDSTYLTSDTGNSWHALNLFIPLSGSYGSYTMGRFTSDKLIAAAYSFDPPKWFVSTNDGASWDFLTTPISESVKQKIFITSSNQLYSYNLGLTNDNIIYRSSDFGQNFESIILSAVNIIYDFVENSLGELFIATDKGIFKSTDEGAAWYDYSDHLLNDNIRSLLLTENGLLFAGTYAAGLFRTLHSTTPVKENIGQQPENFALYQNYPNPFNPSTVISYQLSAFSNVVLKIFDVLGKEVATLVNEEKEPGIYNSQFSIDNYQLQSGVYFYQLRVGNPSAGSGQDFVETKKMILLR